MKLLRLALIGSILLALIASPVSASVSIPVEVVALSIYNADGHQTGSIQLAVPRGVDSGARTGNTEFLLQLSVTYAPEDSLDSLMTIHIDMPLEDTEFLFYGNAHGSFRGEAHVRVWFAFDPPIAEPYVPIIDASLVPGTGN